MVKNDSIALGDDFHLKWPNRLNARLRLFEKFEENILFMRHIDSVIIFIITSFENTLFGMGICIVCAFWTWGGQELMLSLSEMTVLRRWEIIKSWLSKSRKNTVLFLLWGSKILDSYLVFTVHLQANVSVDSVAWWSSSAKRQCRGDGSRDKLQGKNIVTLPEYVGVASGNPKLKCSWDLHRKCNKNFHLV